MMASLPALILRNAAVKARLGAMQMSTAQLTKHGKRDVVGYGWNGQPIYFDRVDYPMPAVRFREETNAIRSLREKEKSDWKKLSIEEKKALYRHSFCQTFSEFKSPTGEWKAVVGVLCMAISVGILYTVWMNNFVYSEHPITFEEDRVKAQLKRILDGEFNPIFGISSQWDYENKKWK